MALGEFRVKSEAPKTARVGPGKRSGSARGPVALAPPSASVAAPSLEAGLLRLVAAPLPEREFHVLRRRDRPPSRAAAALLAAVGAPLAEA